MTSTSTPAMDSAGAKSVMSNTMKELHEGKEEISNIIHGHQANLSNPSMSHQATGGTSPAHADSDTSEKSKKNSERIIEELGGRDTQEAARNKPISKDAAEELYGTRAAAG